MEQVTPNYTIVVQAIIFLISLFIVKKFILDPIAGLLRERSARIEGGEEEARRLEQEASAIDTSCRQKIQEARIRAMAVRHEMRQEALSREKEILKEGRGKAQEILEHIRTEIATEVDAAKSMLHEKASELSVLFGEKLLGRKIQ